MPARPRPQVAGTVTGPWCVTTITACAINADATASAADRLMAKRTTFTRKYHAKRPEETPNG